MARTHAVGVAARHRQLACDVADRQRRRAGQGYVRRHVEAVGLRARHADRAGQAARVHGRDGLVVGGRIVVRETACRPRVESVRRVRRRHRYVQAHRIEGERRGVLPASSRGGVGRQTVSISARRFDRHRSRGGCHVQRLCRRIACVARKDAYRLAGGGHRDGACEACQFQGLAVLVAEARHAVGCAARCRQRAREAAHGAIIHIDGGQRLFRRPIEGSQRGKIECLAIQATGNGNGVNHSCICL